jgi:predicted NodU family carbamoyl transferase
MDVLGISAYYHDSAAALLRDGEILSAAQEERFSRKKHDPAFPAGAIRYCLKEAGIRLTDLDQIVFYDKPLLKFDRLLETYFSYAPRPGTVEATPSPRSGRSIFRTRLACCIPPSPTSPASRSTRASTSSWVWRHMGNRSTPSSFATG